MYEASQAGGVGTRFRSSPSIRGRTPSSGTARGRGSRSRQSSDTSGSRYGQSLKGAAVGSAAASSSSERGKKSIITARALASPWRSRAAARASIEAKGGGNTRNSSQSTPSTQRPGNSFSGTSRRTHVLNRRPSSLSPKRRSDATTPQSGWDASSSRVPSVEWSSRNQKFRTPMAR